MRGEELNRDVSIDPVSSTLKQLRDMTLDFPEVGIKLLRRADVALIPYLSDPNELQLKQPTREWPSEIVVRLVRGCLPT